MGTTVLTLGLRERSRMLGWLVVALIGLVVYVLSAWPWIRDDDAFLSIIDDLPPVLQALFDIQLETYATGAGYLEAQVMSMLLPALFAVVAIGAGASLIAGREEAGTMDLLLTTRESRSSVVTQSGATIEGILGTLAIVAGLAMIIGDMIVTLDLGIGHVIAAMFMLFLYGMHYGMMALMIGSVTGRSGMARGLTAAAAVTSYVATSLSRLIDELAWVQPLSAYHRFADGRALSSGMPWVDALILIAGITVMFVIALWGFSRRDVRSA